VAGTSVGPIYSGLQVWGRLGALPFSRSQREVFPDENSIGSVGAIVQASLSTAIPQGAMQHLDGIAFVMNRSTSEKSG
jgi:hypothetical protein